LEKLFGLSPSLYVFACYQALYAEAQSFASQNSGNDKAMRLDERAKTLKNMQKTLSRANWPASAANTQDFSLKLSQVWDEIKVSDYTSDYEPTPSFPRRKLRDSFFSQGKWAVGLAGGPLVARKHGSFPPAYLVSFVARPIFDFYEMAKAKHLPVKMGFGTSIIEEGQMYGGSSVPEWILESHLPLWAITEQGLLPAKLENMKFYGGDLCEKESIAKVVFERPPKGRIFGFFASNVPIDPATAQVKLHKRTYLEENGVPPCGDCTTLTLREEASVDLDQDGIDDLRVVLSQDGSAFNEFPGRRENFAQQGYFRKVAGWYAADIFALQANENGQWQTLSSWQIITCT
jgi:hypothetical protein